MKRKPNDPVNPNAARRLRKSCNSSEGAIDWEALGGYADGLAEVAQPGGPWSDDDRLAAREHVREIAEIAGAAADGRGKRGAVARLQAAADGLEALAGDEAGALGAAVSAEYVYHRDLVVEARAGSPANVILGRMGEAGRVIEYRQITSALERIVERLNRDSLGVPRRLPVAAVRHEALVFADWYEAMNAGMAIEPEPADGLAPYAEGDATVVFELIPTFAVAGNLQHGDRGLLSDPRDALPPEAAAEADAWTAADPGGRSRTPGGVVGPWLSDGDP